MCKGLNSVAFFKENGFWPQLYVDYLIYLSAVYNSCSGKFRWMYVLVGIFFFKNKCANTYLIVYEMHVSFRTENLANGLKFL